MEIDIYTLAHEIKNPLAIAKGYLEMSNQDNFNKYYDLINSNIMEALNILDNYLNYKKMCLDSEVIDIILLLEEVKSNYCELNNITIYIISIYDEIFIDADYYKLKQVFSNLIKNSIEAKSTKIDIFLKRHDNNLIISIVDNGEGFNNTKKLVGYSYKINGHGIGLVITKKIIELHSGTIEYVNNDDMGCNILVNLPINL